MIVTIHKTVPGTTLSAYRWFVSEISNWWPRAYSWSKQQLVNMRIDARPNGLCTETGPYLFRCDWGRVLNVEEGKMIRLAWQIGPDRVPEPDPDKASEVLIRFTAQHEGCRVSLQHARFEKHGGDYQAYAAAMGSAQGWDYILNCYLFYARQQSRQAGWGLNKKQPEMS